MHDAVVEGCIKAFSSPTTEKEEDCQICYPNLSKDQQQIANAVYSIIIACRRRTYGAITYAFYSGLNEFNFELNTICQTRPAQITIDLVAEKMSPSISPTLSVTKSKLIQYK